MSVIICDVDGVVASFVPFLISEIKNILPNTKIPELNDIKNYNLFQFFEKGKALNAVFSCMSRETFWNKLPIIDGAKEAIKKLEELNHTVLFVTKPWYKCLGWVPVRLDYLQKNFNASEKNIIFTTCKEYVNGDIFIDDNPEYISNWTKFNHNKKTFVFDAPYNREYRSKNCKRIKDWKKDLDKILKVCNS